MTFDKYNNRNPPLLNTVFPNDGYDYDYVCDKKIGWIQVRGKKLSDLPKQKWDVKIPKEVNNG